MSGDGVGAGSGTGVDPGGAGVGPDWSVVNCAVVAVFTLPTLVGMILSVGRGGSVVAIPDGETGAVTVPPSVYLLAGFWALGYISTRLMGGVDRATTWSHRGQLVGTAMRVPAAWILAAGIYPFPDDLRGTGGIGPPRLTAGVTFLLGLYVSDAVNALGSRPDRIPGRPARTGK